MNTPAHLIFGVAAFGDPGRRYTSLAAVLGSLAPDLSLYLMAGVSLFILQIPPQVVFDELYFSDAWQTVFAVDNSFLVWGAILALGVWRRSAVIVAFAGGALLHIGLDFPLHHDDGRPHFWPLSNWVFESPFSYWDRRQSASFIAPLEGAMCLGLTVLIWRRYTSWVQRAIWTLVLALEIWVIRGWFMFVF